MDPLADRLIRAYPEDQPPRILRTTKADALGELERLRTVIAGLGDVDRFPEGPAGVVLYALLRAQADICPDVGDFGQTAVGCERLLDVVARAIRDDGPWGRPAHDWRWRRLIRHNAFGCEFAPGATDAALATAERALGVALPAELTDFLRETNGASAAYDAGLVWSLAKIVSVSHDVGARHAPTDPTAPAAPAERLLCFADDGTRGRYAYVLVDGTVRGRDVFFWEQATGRRWWVAASLADYVDHRLDGTLPRDGGQP